MSTLAATQIEADSLTLARDGDIAIITLARSSAMNAVNDALRIGLVRACEEVSASPGIKAVLVRAEGERAFCVGADIKEDRPALSPTEARKPPADRDYTNALAAMRKPVVCAIHGFCLGAGLEIALACDIRIASADATFGLPEVNLGLIPGAGGTQRLTRLIGSGRALDMMLSGERIDAARALDYGLVTRLAPSRADLHDAAIALTRALAAKAPVAIAYLKEAVCAGMDGSLGAGLARERDLFTMLLTTEDKKEAAEAFKMKRSPVFQGR
ncbi:enoyl-CoA hydratase/isomerase family protein [Microvirga sp. SRT01]|uniref:Enoyl-CoA hydratase/isomerase family protein n=1 Tax=Sphingomonas longa TaxID=2778730 RepID=A0ABS2DCL2_9SPHN|nr:MULTISPECIES: enoyl-CoA hydratase-related protein [Alphaproteobacteria]MBM6577814.1 enoyl-CoA hydratase/isomerase family protein [Sphingomonas sp. BT552]MBR7710856.1 enoyl-CoA hydratase/isomerase family protein [Microvirga sp. SRT01]